MSKAHETVQDLADRLFPQESEDMHRDSILSIKPEQRRLHTETYDFSVSTLLDYIKDKRIFVPEFQRRYVWSDAQASRLVESLIIQCPIPVIYLNQEQDERLSVIDGNQRLKSLERFANNIFPLRGLTAYPELEENLFHQLDPRFQRHILNRTLRCIVILKDTHPQVKFDVFERLNTGSVKLTPQELRHGLYFGPLMELVAKLAKNKDWANLFPAGPDRRMRSEEFIIRFLAFHYDLDNYEKPLSAFLNSFAGKNRAVSAERLAEYKTLFEEVAALLRKVYGDFAFKVFDADRNIVSGFNAALFDAEITAVSGNLAKARAFSEAKRNAWLNKLASMFSDPEFAKSIARATSDERLVNSRISKIRHQFAAI
jgi:hypothetical protein